MPEIKFSHHYLKLPDRVKSAQLLQVLCCYDTELSPAFIDYDTVWFHDDQKEFYQLPKGRLLLLLFRDADSLQVFSTVRPWAPNKERWYRNQQGIFFDVVVSEENDSGECSDLP
jgi:hypothetical protein